MIIITGLFLAIDERMMAKISGEMKEIKLIKQTNKKDLK